MNRILRNFVSRYQEILLPATLFIASAILVTFGILPVGSKVFDLWNTVGETRESVRLLSDKEVFLSSQDEFTLQKKLMTIISAVPQNKSLASVFGLIDSLSSETGVTLLSLSLSGGQLSTASAKLSTSQEKAIGASLLPFTVTLAGPASGIVEFIARATQVRRLLKFQNFDIGLASSGAATLSVNFQAFYEPLPQISAVAGESLPQLTSEDNATLDKLTTYAWLSEQLAAQASTTRGKTNPFFH